uniref:Uncharacterized protein n=1 Tax=Salix viminalis TaxID=40686 RepID=A0A6N2L4M4_SALVM
MYKSLRKPSVSNFQPARLQRRSILIRAPLFWMCKEWGLNNSPKLQGNLLATFQRLMVTITLRPYIGCSSLMVVLDSGFCGALLNSSLTPRLPKKSIFWVTNIRASCLKQLMPVNCRRFLVVLALVLIRVAVCVLIRVHGMIQTYLRWSKMVKRNATVELFQEFTRMQSLEMISHAPRKTFLAAKKQLLMLLIMDIQGITRIIGFFLHFQNLP